MYIRITELLKQAPLSTGDLKYLMPGVAPSTIEHYIRQLLRHGFIIRINGEYHLMGNKPVLSPCKRCQCLVLSWNLDKAGRCKECQPEQTLSFVARGHPSRACHSFASRLMQTPFKQEELEKLCNEPEV